MKIKITENQAKRLKLISEDSNPLSQFEHFCAVKVQEVNKLYGKIINITIAEIAQNEVSMKAINGVLDKIDQEIHVGNKRTYDYINNLPDEDLDLRIDRASSSVMDKLTPLQLISMDLEKLQEAIQERNLLAPFKDLKPLDISGLQGQ